MHRIRHRSLSVPVALAAGLALAACGTSPTATSSTDPSATPGPDAAGPVGGDEREVDAVTPRVLLAHDAGLTLLDAETGEVLHEEAREGFLRLGAAGDGRHVVVADGGTFRVFDAGIEEQAHGDHAHAYEFTPGLTDVTYEAPHAGHVVPHGGRTALWSDGEGSVQLLDTAAVADPDADVTRLPDPSPHHGVAVPVEGGVVMTHGTEEERSEVRFVRDDEVLARTTDCPGVHGEASAAPDLDGDVVLFGCEDGPVVFRGGDFHKVEAPDDYARTGNAAGSPVSSVVLTDYKTDPDGDPERPTRVALVDTREDSLRLVDLGSAYWFRSLARGPMGEGVVLTYDGSLAVVDVEAGVVDRRIPVVAPWQEKEDWQEPGPVLQVAGDLAYVTDAERRELVVADLTSGEVVARHALDHAPVEMAVVTGEAGGH
ncbi:hypothetical protein [Phycicoccus avicenniae]|uniref:hypothetical protein n=1 Tax=Phycicoccus avicenniae TaxID=2828860 RepID=UPI00201322B0|nr:hypothetical protein [Phycicoccus avicenniae]